VSQVDLDEVVEERLAALSFAPAGLKSTHPEGKYAETGDPAAEMRALRLENEKLRAELERRGDVIVRMVEKQMK
jgi:hypothetical protein